MPRTLLTTVSSGQVRRCVLGPLPELSYPMYLLTHRDLRKAPRVRGFFDFCLSELRPILMGVSASRPPRDLTHSRSHGVAEATSSSCC
jgi:hypothetical protein